MPTPANASDTYKGQIQDIVQNTAANSVVLFGDSKTAQCSTNLALTSLTNGGSGTTATGTFTGHDLIVGQQFVIGGANEAAYNGLFTVATVPTANTFTYTMLSDPGGAATGSFNLTNHYKQQDYGYFNWLNAQLGGRFNVVFNAGIAADTVEKMATRTAHVTAFNPDYCFHCGFINDVTGGRTAAQIIADLTTIYEALLSAGIIVVATTEVPFVTGAIGYTTAGRDILLIVNNWIRKYALENKNVLLLDVYDALVDGTSATGAPLADMLWAADGIHISPKGARTVGNAGYNLLNSIVPAVNTLANSRVDDYTTNTANPNVVINGMMAGTGGTLAGGATGSAADNWSLDKSTSATCAGLGQQTRADGRGYNQNIVVTSSASGQQCKFYTSASLHGRFTAGDQVYFEADISITSATNLGGLFFRIQTSIDGNSSDIAAMTTTNTDPFDNSDMSNFVFKSNTFTYPAGATIASTFIWFQVYFLGTGGATIDIGRVVLRKS